MVRKNKNKHQSSVTIGVVGAGGDGVVVLGSFLQRLAASQGYFSQMPRYYGAQIRGGSSAVKLELNAESLSLPKDSLDILVCFNWDKYLEFEQELPLAVDTLVIYETKPQGAIKLPEPSFQVDFSKKSKEVTGSTQNKNIVALGLLKRILALPDKKVKVAIETDIELELLKANLPALEAGEHLFPELSLPEFKLAPATDKSAKLIIHGNAAMAQAAIHADCRAFFGYPITPAAEIMQEMQKELSRNKGVFLQTEDEIASAGLVIGSSIVGAKSMTSTSGPGLDLMTEMMGLASAAEIPMVIIDVQRCGPSTGIPSKSEQSDLNHAIYGGHGDGPRVVLAPYDVEGCYRLVIEGFSIAQYFQTPVVILSDQWLGQTFLAINNRFMTEDYPSHARISPAVNELADYHRYQLTDKLISPMAAVGDEGFTYQTTGLTHNEEGAPAFDFETHQRMHEKRWRKLAPLCQRNDLVKVFGKEESSTGIITWGSSAQVVLETVKALGLEHSLKLCVPELVHPLPIGVERFISSIKKLLVVEMNYSGQFYHYLRSQIDLPKKTELYARAGGRLFSRKELAQPITKVAK
ncbi:MAG TPA: 2-oxoacid:acceptor oxidoreductase subunit alpha [Dehalococcoidia bacterium]|nr:2-oxoacid:acceptor oxidoreductase subunit alpha [Dehalococcoidia bacterium]